MINKLESILASITVGTLLVPHIASGIDMYLPTPSQNNNPESISGMLVYAGIISAITAYLLYKEIKK